MEDLSHPALAPSPEHLFNSEEMHLALSLVPPVVVKDHVGPLRREHPDVLGVVVPGVTINVMHHLTREQGTTQLPFGNGPVLVVRRPGARVTPLA